MTENWLAAGWIAAETCGTTPQNLQKKRDLQEEGIQTPFIIKHHHSNINPAKIVHKSAGQPTFENP